MASKLSLTTFGENVFGEFVTNTQSINKYLASSSVGEVAVSSGDHHSVIRCRDLIFAVGSNFFGQLALGKSVKQADLNVIEYFNQHQIKVKNIICKYNQTFFLTDVGEVFVVGFNEECNLGFKSKESNIYDPTKVCGCLEGKVITKIAVGRYHCLMLDANHRVFVSGQQDKGQLFLTTSHRRTSNIIENDVMTKHAIDDIECGQFFSVAFSASQLKLFVGGVVAGSKKPLFEEYDLNELIGFNDNFPFPYISVSISCCNNCFIIRAFCEHKLFMEEDVFLKWDGTGMYELSDVVAKTIREQILRITTGPKAIAFVTNSGRIYLQEGEFPENKINPTLVFITVSHSSVLEALTEKGVIMITKTS
ncbi:hypothetical protein C9374_008599 [Naegleria lovaniensis]|uniref:Uncharacterized protein n=1 Tax=Naegleria lovaniensis TaxID=51637 RepID=A0AA88GEH0_NAELO|nr:uncharacterized protein C9374_008599 [Naegleria lovaniensis]KAG2377977.1 hypothetical protein C9374_008599 [Naegleria lovaniensis]